MSNILDGKYIKNGTIPASKLSSVILNDIGSPTTAYNFGNQELRNLSKLIIGQNTTSDYNLFLKTASFSTLGTTKGSACISDSTYTANSFLGIDFNQANSGIPTARLSAYFTDDSTFMYFFVSNNPSAGTTAAPFGCGYFPEGLGGKFADSVFFTTNNLGSIGTSSVAVANIYSVNALNITSDNNQKKDINKSFPLGLNFALDIAKNAIATYKWKDTIQEEKKVTNFKKVEKIDKKTNEKTIDYELETIILEEKKVTKHTRNHLGFLGVELYDTIKQHGFDTNQIGFLSIDNENGLNFDKKGNPIIENNRPKGKITIKTGEMMPILFNAIFELNKIVDDLKKEIQVLKEK